jgi:ATP-binding cassette, subfamily B, multidrug efflux pump
MKSLFALKPYLGKYKWQYLGGSLCILLATAVFLLQPRVLQIGIDSLIRRSFPAWTHPYGIPPLVFLSILVVAIALVHGVFRYAMRQLMIGASRRIEYDLRNDLFRHLETLEPAYYSKTRIGDLMTRATSDMNNIRMFLGPGIMQTVNPLFSVILALTQMFALDWRLTLLVLLPAPFVSVVTQRLGTALHKHTERVQAALSDLSTKVQENLSGMRVVKAYVQGGPELREFQDLQEEYIKKSKDFILINVLFDPLLFFLVGITTILVLAGGGYEVIHGRMTIGGLVAFNTYLMFLAWPMIAIGWVVNLAQRGAASMGRVNEILSAKPAITDTPDADSGLVVKGALTFEGISFAYNGTPVLKGVSFEVPEGTSLAIVGPTGSGKSTLVSLIPRLYEPKGGEIRIDGHPLIRFPLCALRKSIGYVSQEPFLFSETVGGNIAFGHPGANTREIEQAAALAQIAGDISGFPKGYETFVGERGITLSGGQKSRTALARALLIDPPILILDDAFANVDTHTEEDILSGLRRARVGKTTILISHRISTVKDADQIVVLDGGVIAERGTHEELLSKGGLYASLYEKQLLREALEED